jgi:hypothetical protein
MLLVPKQEDYFHRVEKDFSRNHKGSVMDTEMLKELGDFNYQNSLIFSYFEYQFGNISVSYYGFFTIIIFNNSEFKETKNPQITV